MKPDAADSTTPLSGDSLREYYGLTEAHWQQLGPEGQAMYALVRPMPSSFYQVDVSLNRLQTWFDGLRHDQEGAGGGLELTPDFQRGHVWTQDQRVAFCESFVRGQASAMLMFNCPSYNDRQRAVGDLNPELVQCVDGLQRLTALVDFAADKFPVYGDMLCSHFNGSPFSASRLHTKVRIYSMRNRAELLGFYLDLNSGGTVHSPQELARVRVLRDASRPVAASAAPARKRSPT